MMTKNDILHRLREIKEETAVYGVTKLGLFGSALHNKQKKESDIDLLVDFDAEKETYNNYISVCDLLEKGFEYEHLDIVTLKGLSPHIGKYILEEVEYV